MARPRAGLGVGGDDDVAAGGDADEQRVVAARSLEEAVPERDHGAAVVRAPHRLGETRADASPTVVHDAHRRELRRHGRIVSRGAPSPPPGGGAEAGRSTLGPTRARCSGGDSGVVHVAPRSGALPMTTSQYFLNLALLAWILSSNLGSRALTRRRFTVPLFVVAAAGWFYLSDAPTLGNDGIARNLRRTARRGRPRHPRRVHRPGPPRGRPGRSPPPASRSPRCGWRSSAGGCSSPTAPTTGSRAPDRRVLARPLHHRRGRLDRGLRPGWRWPWSSPAWR